MSQFVQIYKLSHTVLRTKEVKHRLTGKSEQNITTNLSHWNPREKGRRLDGATSSCCSCRAAHSCKKSQCTLVKCNAF